MRRFHQDYVDIGHVLGPDDCQAPQRGIERPSLGVSREALAERIAEPHVHAAFDLALAQHRVHRPADIVSGNDTLHIAGLGIENDHLGGVAERGVDDRILQSLGQRVGPVDPVLALVIHLGPASVGQRSTASVGHRTRAHEGAPAAGGLAGTELARGIHNDPNRLGIDAELLHGDLQRDGVHALAHLRPAVADLHGAVGTEADDRLGDLFEAIAETGVLQPQPDPDRLARSAGRFVRLAHGVEASLCAEAAVIHDLSRSPHSPRHHHVALAHFQAVDPDRFGQPIHDAFHGELRLIRSEAPESAAHRIVGAHRDRLDVHSRHQVRPGGMARRAFQHLHAHRGIRARVAEHARPHCGELAVGVAADLIGHADGVPLGVHQ